MARLLKVGSQVCSFSFISSSVCVYVLLDVGCFLPCIFQCMYHYVRCLITSTRCTFVQIHPWVGCSFTKSSRSGDARGTMSVTCALGRSVENYINMHYCSRIFIQV